MDKPLNPMDKQLIAARFAKARNTYTREARVQQQVAEKMMQLIKEPYTRFRRVVEFGCGTGSYSRILLHTLQPEALLLNDLCREMEECVKELCDGTTVQFVPGDAEAIDFPAVELLDQINLMTYDCDGPIHSSYAFAESCLNYWLEERHFPPEKLTLGLPFYGRYAHWQWKPHIYLNPLYYIDYCMAGTVAFQVWTLSLQDRKAAWEKYLAFVDQAGTKTFADLCQSVGLRVPYEDGCIREVGSGIRDWLKAHAPVEA